MGCDHIRYYLSMSNFISDVKQSKAENSDDDVYEKLTGKSAPGGRKIKGSLILSVFNFENVNHVEN